MTVRLIAVLAVITAVTVVPAGPVSAQPRQTGPCHIADRDLSLPLPTSGGYDTAALWRFGRGAGQTVAVIDTGVNPHPRLPGLRGGGDLITGDTGGGLADCDGHGTLVAGLIAARPDSDDDFAGLAPDAQILSIRQSSSRFADPDGDRSATGSLRTLAAAVHAAIDGGATVINISEVACAPGPDGAYSPALDEAIDAAVRADVVVVVAAGNTGADCVADPAPVDPLQNGSAADRVVTDVAPAHFSPRVLTVGAVTATGDRADYSLPGPWVRVAAPGDAPVSLSTEPGGRLATRVRTEYGVEPISGTSFAAPLVAGTAALVRARYPELTAAEVIDRIVRTAVPVAGDRDPYTGAGVLDPVAAVTAPDPPGPAAVGGSVAIAAPKTPVAPDDPARRRATLVAGAAMAAGVLAVAGAALRRRRD